MSNFVNRLYTLLAKNYSAINIIGNRIASLAAQLAVLPILAKHLGVSGIGVWAYCQLIIQLAGTSIDMGYNITGIKEVVNCNSDSKKVAEVYRAIQSNRAIFLLAGTSSIAVISINSPVDQMLPILLTILALVGIHLSPQWYFNGCRKIFVYTNTCTAFRILSLACIFALHLANKITPTIIYTLVFSGELCIGLFCHIYISRTNSYIKPFKYFFEPNWGQFKKSLTAWTSSLSSIFVSFCTALTIKYIGGFESLGIYSAAERVYKVAQSFLWPILQSYLPNIAARKSGFTADNDNSHDMQKYFLAAIIGSISIVLFFFSSEIIDTLYGSKFAASSAILKIFSIAFFAYSINLIIQYYRYFSIGRNDIALKTAAMSAVILIIMSILSAELININIAHNIVVACELGVLIYLITIAKVSKNEK